MFFGFLYNLLHGFSTIFFKKSLTIENTMSPFSTYVFGFVGALIIYTYFLLSINLDFSNLTISIISLILFVITLGSLIDNINQYVYRNEKISLLLPYTYLNKIISVVLAFFVFGNLSLITFFIAISICLMIILSNVDYKNLGFSKSVKLFIFNQFLVSIKTILLGIILKEVSTQNYFVIETSIVVFVGFLILSYKKEVKNIFIQNKYFYTYSMGSSFFGYASYLLGLFLVSKLGIVLNILFSFLYFILMLVFSFLFFGDKPSDKNIILSFFIIVMVVLGFEYR